MKVYVVTQEGEVIGVTSDPSKVNLPGQVHICVDEYEVDHLPHIPEGSEVWGLVLGPDGIRSWRITNGFRKQYVEKGEEGCINGCIVEQSEEKAKARFVQLIRNQLCR